MAHYNFPRRLLRMAKADPSVMSIERAVERLTSEIARWFAIDAGILDVGKRADLVVIDPTGLNDALEQVHEEEMRDFGGLRRMVRRNDAAVRAVVINGRVAAERSAKVPEFGVEHGFGRVLRAGPQASDFRLQVGTRDAAVA